MALYIIPLLIIVLLVLFILRRGKKNKKTGPSEEEYLAKVLKEVDQSQEEKGEAVEEPKETTVQPIEAKAQTEQPKEPQQAPPVEEPAPTPVESEPAPAPEPATAVEPKPKPAPAKPKQRFTPSNPLIKQYETHLNLEMLRAQNAGDEDAYIDIVRKNSVYMKNCTLLNKAMAEKNKEKALASLKKIREMIPKDFRPE
ncbi:MAG: hypothetical protein ACRBB4_10265 [Neptuniibacter sp.]